MELKKMNNSWKKFIGILTTFVVFLFPLKTMVDFVAGETQISKDVSKSLDDVIQNYNIPGGALVLIKNGNISQIKYYGDSDLKNHFKVNRNTVFKIASVSKTMTAYGIMKLVDKGLLDLDKPVNRYLTKWKIPESEYDVSKVTLRTLLSHTSGLSDSSEEGYKEQLPTIAEALKERNIRLIREPGTKFEYSSFAGFGVCQLIIEEVTGMSFGEYMAMNVFEPLHMRSAGYYNSSMAGQVMAVPYAGMGKAIAVTSIVMNASGGVSATAEDLAKFVIGVIDYYHKGNKEMFRIQDHTISEYGVYGLGIIPHMLPDGRTIYEHNGTLTGWNAQIAFEPQSGEGFAFLSNSDKAYYLTNDLLKIWSQSLTGYPIAEKPFAEKLRRTIYVECPVVVDG
jgi:CubicO group peptidase (beta-lactamase class C family)